MADHLRQQIRDAAVTALTGLTTTGSNVFATRFYPQETSNLPCLLVYTLSEESAPESTGATGTMARSLLLAIDGVARAVASLDETLDDIAKEVEVALMADVTLGGLAKDAFIEATEIEVDAIGDKPVGVIKMEFNVMYLAVKNAPDTSK